ncbi:MAG: RNA-binding S4 domain-containing protein [Terrimicrobiaceae bacterium]
MSNSDTENTRIIPVNTAPIELCQFMKLGGLAQSGGEAKHLIRGGHVLLNGEVETRKGKKLLPGDRVTFEGRTLILQTG